MRSTPSLRSLQNVTFETVPMFVRLTMAHSRPFKEDRLTRPLYVTLRLIRLKSVETIVLIILRQASVCMCQNGVIQDRSMQKITYARHRSWHVRDQSIIKKHQNNQACTKRCQSSKRCSWILNGRRRRSNKQTFQSRCPPKHTIQLLLESARESAISLLNACQSDQF